MRKPVLLPKSRPSKSCLPFSDVKTGGAAYLLDVSEEFDAGDCQSWRAHRTEGCIGTKETACSTVKATGESGNSGYPCLTENGG